MIPSVRHKSEVTCVAKSSSRNVCHQERQPVLDHAIVVLGADLWDGGEVSQSQKRICYQDQ